MLRFAAEMLHHKALGLGMEYSSLWRRGRNMEISQAKSARNKGAVGRLISIDPWGNGTCIVFSLPRVQMSRIRSLFMDYNPTM